VLVNFDIKTLIIGLLLGIISGVGYANVFGIDWWDEISSIGSLLGGIAGFGALLVAYIAYQKWQRGIDYSLFLQQYKSLADNVNEIFYLLEKYIIFREVKTCGVETHKLTEEEMQEDIKLLREFRKLFAAYDVELNLIGLALPNAPKLETEIATLTSLKNEVKKIKGKPITSEYDEHDKLEDVQTLQESINITICKLMVKCTSSDLI
jgi:hypothetical protein